MEIEIVSGTGEEAKPCSSDIESGKQLNDAVVAQENGVRVSENGVGDSVHPSDNDAETKNLNDEGLMNGVSSLLKLKENVTDEDEEDVEEEHKYFVGDFVWGKVRNHPWWPGQIYDPSEASDLALKKKQNGKLLVAYFGDGTFAWCSPSQLKPFTKSFKECSSNSKSVIVAVKEAVEEIGRHIESFLLCDCTKGELSRREVKNAGIKEGVSVRDVCSEVIDSLLVGKCGDMLNEVKCFAEKVSVSGLLDLEILKRKQSAFYRFKTGYGLLKYDEPELVPGLEDKNKDGSDDDDDDDGGDAKESCKNLLEKCSSVFPDHRMHHRRKEKSIAEILGNESAAKVSSETEEEDGNGKTGRKKVKRLDEVNGELAIVTYSSRRKKRDLEEDDNVDDDGNGAMEIYDDSTLLSSLRKRTRIEDSSVEKTPVNGEASTETTKRERKKSSKYLSPDYLTDFSFKGRRKSKVESESSKGLKQITMGEQMTEADNSLALVEVDNLDKPCETSLDNEGNSLALVEVETVDKPLEASLDNALVAVEVETSLANGITGHPLNSEELKNAADFLKLGATAVEMCDLIRETALGTQYPQDISSTDMVREFMSIYRSFTYNDGANSKFLGNYSTSDIDEEELNEADKTKEKRSKDKKPETKMQAEEMVKRETVQKERKPNKPKLKSQSDREEEETKKEASESRKKERKPNKAKSKSQGDDRAEETLKEANESTKKGRKPNKPKPKNQSDREEETPKEVNGSRKKERKPNKPKAENKGDREKETRKEANESSKKERKRKKPESKEVDDDEEEATKDASKSSKKERNPKKGRYVDDEPEKEKKEEEKSKKKETEEEFSGAELFVTFGPGSNLPNKEELTEIYKKFGALDEERTYMFYNNFCARVAFLNIADGEQAYKSSLEKSPFDPLSTVKFRLGQRNERREEEEEEEEKAEVVERKTEIEYVKKKLDEMRSLVDECEEGMTGEVRKKLEDGIGNLLQKVKKTRST